MKSTSSIHRPASGAAGSVKPAAKPRPNNVVAIEQHRGYRWRDRDPRLDQVCRIIDDSGFTPFEISQRIARISGGGAHVAATTIRKWLDGTVKRPQSFTTEWAIRACGWELLYRRIRGWRPTSDT